MAKARTLTDPVVVDIADRVGRTPSQVTLRWHIERGDVVFPKTMSTARMHENLDIFAFQLETDDQVAISALDEGEAGRIGPHPDTMDWLDT